MSGCTPYCSGVDQPQGRLLSTKLIVLATNSFLISGNFRTTWCIRAFGSNGFLETSAKRFYLRSRSSRLTRNIWRRRILCDSPLRRAIPTEGAGNAQSPGRWSTTLSGHQPLSGSKILFLAQTERLGQITSQIPSGLPTNRELRRSV